MTEKQEKELLLHSFHSRGCEGRCQWACLEKLIPSSHKRFVLSFALLSFVLVPIPVLGKRRCPQINNNSPAPAACPMSQLGSDTASPREQIPQVKGLRPPRPLQTRLQVHVVTCASN